MRKEGKKMLKMSSWSAFITRIYSMKMLLLQRWERVEEKHIWGLRDYTVSSHTIYDPSFTKEPRTHAQRGTRFGRK